MPSLKQAAQAYEPPQTKNISELDVIDVELGFKEEKHKKTNEDGTEEEFTVKIVEIDGEKYRVPNSVLEQLQSQLEVNPNMRKFRVKKKGTGLGTKYTVVPLQEQVAAIAA